MDLTIKSEILSNDTARANDGQVKPDAEVDDAEPHVSSLHLTPEHSFSRSDTVLEKPSHEERPGCKRTGFLSLSAELRNRIYGYCFSDSAGPLLVEYHPHGPRRIQFVPFVPNTCRPLLKKHCFLHRPLGRDRTPIDEILKCQKPQLRAQLLSTCRQILHEARPILYSQPIVFQTSLALLSFLETIGAEERRMLRNLTVLNWGHSKLDKARNLRAMTILSCCTSLQALSLHETHPCAISPLDAARRIYKETRPFLTAFGAAKGRQNAALDILHLRTWTRHDVVVDLPNIDAEQSYSDQLEGKLEQLMSN